MKRTTTKNEFDYIVDGEIINHSIIPKTKNELNRNVQLFGRSIIEGGIFANDLIIDGEFAYIKKAVNAKESITVKLKSDSSVWFNSVVSARHTILVDKTGEGRVRFSNAISAQIVNLSNSIVYGNIFCDEIILNHCVVLGGVYAKKSISLTNCIIGTYDTKTIAFNSDSALILPFGVSIEKPRFFGKVFCILSKNHSDESQAGVFEIMHEELYPVFENDTHKFILTPFLRFFDLSSFYDNIGQNILSLSYFTSKDVEDVEEDDKSFKEFDDSFFRIISKGFSLNGKTPLSKFMDLDNELIKQFLLKKDGQEKKPNSEDFPGDIPAGPPHEKQDISESGGKANTPFEDEAIVGEVYFEPEQAGEGLQEEELAEENESDLSLCCPHCSAEIIDPEQKFCTECGQDIFKPELKICSACSKLNHDQNLFCEFCGNKIIN